MIPSDLTGIPDNILRKMVHELEAKLAESHPAADCEAVAWKEVERLRESEKAASDCYAAAEAELTALRAEVERFQKENPDSMYFRAALRGGGK